MNYYKRHIGDYMRDTSHLSLLEHGAYTKLLDLYYVREEPLPDDEVERLIGARTPAEKKATRAVLKEFFRLEESGWRHARCDREIELYRAKAERNRLAGAKGGRPRKSGNPLGSESKPTENPNGFQTQTHEEPFGNPTETLATSHKYKYSVRANPADSPSLDAVLFAEARKVFGTSIGGQINRAIKAKGKGWVMDMIETCRSKDPEAARAYLAAALKEPERKVVV
mgnify:CR=1 FL=1